MSQSELELETRTEPVAPFASGDHEEEPGNQGPEFSLPPVDGGKSAWLFLAACWFVEAFIWGFANSWGIFQDYYTEHADFDGGSGNIAAVGTTATGLMYIGTPIFIATCRLYPRAARYFVGVGISVASISFVASSFATTVAQLIGTQGILSGIGGCMASAPCVLYTEQWFVKRRGMAYGVTWSASGFGGAAFPFLMSLLLRSFGFRTALRIWAGVLFASVIPLAYFIRPRLPYAAATRAPPYDLRYFSWGVFTLHQLANVVQGMGYYLPPIYLPTYARSVYGAKGFLPTLTVFLLNLSATAGSVIMGSLTDRMQVTNCIIISTIGTTIGVVLIWGLSSSLPFLYIFCVVYGLFAGCWTSIWPGIMKEVALWGESSGKGPIDSLMVFSWLCVGRGIGNIVSGPISGSLLQGMTWKDQALGGFGSGYGSLILFTSISTVFGGSSFLWKRMGLW